MVSRLSPGYLFDLKGHFRKSFNQEYMVTSIEHEGAAPSYLTDRGEAEEQLPDYGNSFTAIPARVQFRPERVTPKSRFHGQINAVVDGETSGDYAELDDQGRYKIRLPFDREDSHGSGKASYWFRKSEPHAGPKEGMHFPLRQQTEVLLTFIDGDPDRPVISNAISNTATPNVVTDKNQTKNVMQTSSGNLMEWEDQAGSERIKFCTPHLSPTGTRGTYMHLGSPNEEGDGVVTTTGGMIRVEVDEASYLDLATLDPIDPEEEYTSAYYQHGGCNFPDVTGGDPKVHEKNFSYIELNTEEEIKAAQESNRYGKQHIWNIAGDRYIYRKGTDHYYGPDLEINYYNGYVENHVEGTFTETYDLPDLTQNAEKFKTNFWDNCEPANSPVEKTWGNTYAYREGCTYEWANAADFGFCGGYTESYGDDNDSASDPANNEHDEYKDTAPSDIGYDFVEKWYGSTYEYQKGGGKDIIDGNWHEEVYGDYYLFMKGDSKEIYHGRTDCFHMGGSSEFFLGGQFELSLGVRFSFY